MKKIDEKTREHCVCGGAPVEVRCRVGKMLSCPNPAKCSANLRTAWHKSIDSAEVQWNSIVINARRTKAKKRGSAG